MVNNSNDYLEQSIWNKLASANLVTGEIPENSVYKKHWYISAMQGFGGWIAGFFLLGFIASLFNWVFDHENLLAIFIFALVGNSVAYSLAKDRQKNEFFQQLALMFNLCGQLLFAWGLHELVETWGSLFFLFLFTYQTIIVVLIDNYSSRLITTWFASFALFALFARLGLPDLNLLVAASVFVFVWYYDFRWKNQLDLWEPVGYGVALSLLLINSHGFSGELFDWWYESSKHPWLIDLSYWLSEIGVAALLAFLVANLGKTYHVEKSSVKIILMGSGLLLLLVLGYLIPGVTAAILLLMVGFMRQKAILFGLGIIAFAGFISWYYYLLEVTLLTKSLLLIAFGFCFLIAYALVYKLIENKNISVSKNNKVENAKDKQAHLSQIKIYVVVSVSILMLLLVNWSIYQKEQILKEGKIVLLKLAPVDPRSLMQGDYMRLRFEIEQPLLERTDANKPTQGNVEIFVVTKNEHQVGTLADIHYTGQALQENQVLMQFRIRHNRVQLATHAFFFQEGTAKDYEKADYGEFRVASNGELLLNNLRDKNFEILGYSRPSN